MTKGWLERGERKEKRATRLTSPRQAPCQREVWPLASFNLKLYQSIFYHLRYLTCIDQRGQNTAQPGRHFPAGRALALTHPSPPPGQLPVAAQSQAPTGGNNEFLNLCLPS
jgi:hypothetical protein